jgi:hypothetical protein
MSNEIDKVTGPVQGTADGSKATRRGFLVGAGAAAGIAGAAAVALKTRTQPIADVAAPAPEQTPVSGRGYHETAHIRKYYETTKV